MLSIVAGIDTESESSVWDSEDRTGRGILSCLQWHKKTSSNKTVNRLPGFLRSSDSIHVGKPVTIQHYDANEDAVVFVYDPEQTPAPEMKLRNGINKDEKLLFMDGELVVHFANASSLKIGDINIVENGLVA